MESYVFEKTLLSDEDIILYNALLDKYDFTLIDDVIAKCKNRLELILSSEDVFFTIEVYFKLKKTDNKGNIEYRPIHTSDLITQICLVCLLTQIMFEDDFPKKLNENDSLNYKNNSTKYKRNLSDISKLIPSNFYGNLPSTKVDYIFIDWKIKYQEYSELVISKYKEYHENKKYSHEVCLDLEKFFPSIDPNFIYAFILSKLKTTYKGNELECLKIAVKKLLFFEMKNIENWIHEYYPKNKELEARRFFNHGIPQGLPQAYYFGNLCMIEVSKAVSEVFNGEAFYYVDDSVIFTNIKDEKTFKGDIKEVNKKIKNKINEYCKSEPIEGLCKDLIAFNKQLKYTVSIHSGEKSTFLNIHDEQKLGIGNLSLLAKPASGLNRILQSTIDELEDDTQKSKIDSILELINKELEYYNNKETERTKNYLKLLKRYKKFYQFRIKLLELREENEINEQKLKAFFSRHIISEDKEKDIVDYIESESIDKEKFFKNFEEDIFNVESNLYVNYLETDSDLSRKFKSAFIIFERKLTEKKTEECAKNLYFSKDIEGNFIFKKVEKTTYNSLPLLIEKIIQPCSKISKDKEITLLAKFCYNLEHEKYIDDFFKKNDIQQKIAFIYFTSEEFKRRLINAIFSHILNVNISDDYCFIKNNNRALLYFELRILTYLRNKKFEVTKFQAFLEKTLQDANDDNCCEKVDSRIIEVIPQFIKFVSNSEYVDDLILTHRIVNGLWKNGSRFLHFYTLHDEEHSIELINSSTRIVRTIDYLKLKSFDYYILFLACYLHDIAMVIHPKLSIFAENSSKSDLIYTQWKNTISDIEKKSKAEQKNVILDYFSTINTFFETHVRNNHAKNSARFIKKKNDFNFINKSVIQTVADVCESHYYDTSEVYGLHSTAKEDVISRKYLMIILRLADLTDMSKERISPSILRENIDHMDKESKFHWISHLITDNCELNAEYTVQKIIKIEDDERYKADIIRKNIINEDIEININLNTKNLTGVKPQHCKFCSARLEPGHKRIRISINPEEKSCNENCNFLCKWVINKHSYLFSELSEFQKYLSNVNQGLFKTQFYVNITYKNTNKLSNNYFDVISERIE